MAVTASTGNAVPAMEDNEPPKMLTTVDFIKQVQRRPAIWKKTGTVDITGKKTASAWRQMCLLTWPDFGSWSADTKRKRCLELQQDWKKLRNSFMIEYCRRQKKIENQNNSLPACKNYDNLSFLIPTIAKDKGTELDAEGPAKGGKPEPLGCSSCCTQDAEEDKQFLLSLLSHMQDVPRPTKLALRSEIIQLIAKYIPSPSTDHSTNTSKN